MSTPKSDLATVNIGVLGVGALGRHHARLYRDIPQASLVGIFDVNPIQAQAVGQEFGLAVFDNPGELMDRCDALSIAVPTDLHDAVVTEALTRGVHVLVEKPLAATPQQGQHLLHLSRQHNLILQVGHVEQFNPVVQFLEGRLTRPRFIEAHRLAPYPPPRAGAKPRGTEVGVVLDLMIHDIELILALLGEKPQSIEAIGVPILSKSEDIANARLTFPSGCVANLTASRVTPEPLRKMRVFESNCYLSLDFGKKEGNITTLKDGAIVKEPVPIEDQNALFVELSHFIDSVLTFKAQGTIPPSRLEAERGYAALEIATAICDAIAKGQPTGS
jgi:predicted dehydrogenase